MFDGKTYNDVTTDTPIGLTAFVNGSGGRWMTYNLVPLILSLSKKRPKLILSKEGKYVEKWTALILLLAIIPVTLRLRYSEYKYR